MTLTATRMSQTLERPMPNRQIFGESLFLIQLGVGAALVAFLFLRYRPESRGSNFKDYGGNAPGPRNQTSGKNPDLLADSRIRPDRTPQGPLRLEGFRFDRAAHEILGISALAPTKEIQAAYREAMKRYHPDRIAAPGTPQWNDAQAIAQAILRARDELLEKAKRRGN